MKKLFRNGLRNMTAQYADLAFNFPDLNLIERLWDVLDKEIQSMEAPPCIREPLLMSWCQIPQHTFRGIEESMP